MIESAFSPWGYLQGVITGKSRMTLLDVRSTFGGGELSASGLSPFILIFVLIRWKDFELMDGYVGVPRKSVDVCCCINVMLALA